MPDEDNKKTFKVVDKRKISEQETENETENVSGETAEAGATETSATPTEPSAGVAESSGEIPNFEADFATFIYSLNTQALLFLGKIPNPISKKYEKDIGTAKYLIDTIDMLSKKTKGNLDENETKLVENILYDLRMAYISEKK
jgi:hypothetical protein